MKKERGLTAKQAAFVREYMVDLNATQATLRAGYKTNQPDVIGCQLLSNPKVAAAVGAAQQKIAAKTDVTVDRVLKEIQVMAFFDITKIESELRTFEDLKALPEEIRRNIAGWSWDKFGNLVVKWNSKPQAIDQLNRYLGMYRDKVELSGPGGGPVQTANATVVVSTDDPVEAARLYSDLLGK